MINDVSHDFLLSLQKFVTGIDVLHDKFFNGDCAVVIKVDLIKYFVDHFVSNFFVKNPLFVSEEDVKLLFGNVAILIDINDIELIL